MASRAAPVAAPSGRLLWVLARSSMAHSPWPWSAAPLASRAATSTRLVASVTRKSAAVASSWCAWALAWSPAPLYERAACPWARALCSGESASAAARSASSIASLTVASAGDTLASAHRAITRAVGLVAPWAAGSRAAAYVAAAWSPEVARSTRPASSTTRSTSSRSSPERAYWPVAIAAWIASDASSACPQTWVSHSSRSVAYGTVGPAERATIRSTAARRKEARSGTSTPLRASSSTRMATMASMRPDPSSPASAPAETKSRAAAVLSPSAWWRRALASSPRSRSAGSEPSVPAATSSSMALRTAGETAMGRSCSISQSAICRRARLASDRAPPAAKESAAWASRSRASASLPP